MADLIDALGLEPRLESAGVFMEGENFEQLYSRLVRGGQHRSLVGDLKREIYRYFESLELPAEPTVYDHLVLGLRPKDVIASFNWDPFLIQAVQRCRRFAAPPRVLHLHGNVAMGSCSTHSKIRIGLRRGTCPECGGMFGDSPLLYPVGKKDYPRHPVIDGSWQHLRVAMRECFILTIFGYGAPASDVAACNLLRSGWGDSESRVIKQTEIIDIRSEDDLWRTWDPFIARDHVTFHRSFYDSVVAQFPRRSVEAMVGALIDLDAPAPFPLQLAASLNGLETQISRLVCQEVLPE